MSNRRSPRGMALVEVLAATMLLAMLGTTCASLLHAARGALPRPDPDLNWLDLEALERFADEAMDDPANSALHASPDSLDLSLPWPHAPGRLPVRIREVQVTAAEIERGGDWIAFSCGDLTVWRRVRGEREVTP